MKIPKKVKGKLLAALGMTMVTGVATAGQGEAAPAQVQPTQTGQSANHSATKTAKAGATSAQTKSNCSGTKAGAKAAQTTNAVDATYPKPAGDAELARKMEIRKAQLRAQRTQQGTTGTQSGGQSGSTGTVQAGQPSGAPKARDRCLACGGG